MHSWAHCRAALHGLRCSSAAASLGPCRKIMCRVDGKRKKIHPHWIWPSWHLAYPKKPAIFFTFLQEFLKKNTLIASAYLVPHNNQRFLQSESFRPLFLKIKRLIWTDIRPILLADIQPAHSVSGQLPDMEGPNIMPAGYPVLPKLKHSLARRFSSKINYLWKIGEFCDGIFSLSTNSIWSRRGNMVTTSLCSKCWKSTVQ